MWPDGVTGAGRRIAVIAVALLAGCKNPPPPPSTTAPPADATTDAATDAAIDAPVDASGVTPDDGSLAAALAHDSGGEPVLLVERRGAVVATNPSGTLTRTLAAAPTTRADYDARTYILWFNRGGQRIAVDLTRPTLIEVPVIDAMPDLGAALAWSRDRGKDLCMTCVLIRVSATPEVAVSTEGFDNDASGPPSAASVAQRRAADGAHPTLTAAGRTFLVELYRRGRAPVTNHFIPLGDAEAPMPRSARKPVVCSYGTCGKSYALPTLQRELMVVGRTCDCTIDSCWAECVWFDSTRGRYATLRAPGRWAADAAPEPACHPELDVSGTGYVLGGPESPGPLVACTAAACRRETGRFLGWLAPGAMSTAPTNEDLSTCEE